MNDLSPLNELYTRDLMAARRHDVRRARPVAPRPHTTRRVLAAGLHRLADRLGDGI